VLLTTSLPWWVVGSNISQICRPPPAEDDQNPQSGAGQTQFHPIFHVLANFFLFNQLSKIQEQKNMQVTDERRIAMGREGL
jgi:hypothetical protein